MRQGKTNQVKRKNTKSRNYRLDKKKRRGEFGGGGKIKRKKSTVREKIVSNYRFFQIAAKHIYKS